MLTILFLFFKGKRSAQFALFVASTLFAVAGLLLKYGHGVMFCVLDADILRSTVDTGTRHRTLGAAMLLDASH